ncbi:MAG: lysylphosphatidylglycerol synthase transmembrane domain-containing protein [Candidatus Heimdallarchaeaceae archaeon]
MEQEPKEKSNNDLISPSIKPKKFPFAHVFKILGALVAVLILILMVIWAGGLSKVLETLKQVNPSIIVIVSGIYLLGWIARGIRWQFVLKNIGINVSLFDSISLNFIGNTYNLILPAKLGDAARVFGIKDQLKSSNDQIKTEGNSHIAKNLSSVVVDRFLDFGAVIVLLFCTLPFLRFKSLPSDLQWVLYFSPAILVASIIIVFLLYRYRDKLPFVSRLPEKIRNFISDTLEGFIKAYTFNKRLAVQIFLSLLIWLIDSMIAFLFFHSIYPSNSEIFVLIIFGIMVANLTKTIPFTPGGIGTYEVAFTTVLTLAGVPPAVSATVALIDHLFKNIFTAIFGVIFGFASGITPVALAKFKVTEEQFEAIEPIEK